jgi:hypothetical protein
VTDLYGCEGPTVTVWGKPPFSQATSEIEFHNGNSRFTEDFEHRTAVARNYVPFGTLVVARSIERPKPQQLAKSFKRTRSWDVEVRSIALSSARGMQMAQLTDRDGFRVVLAAPASPDRTADPVAIFSTPDVVFHWWAESKRRWEEENRARALTTRPIARVADESRSDSD